jgi:hypothetical protein
LWRSNAEAYLSFLDAEGSPSASFSCLERALKAYLLWRMNRFDTWAAFGSALPTVLKNCDREIYNSMENVLAYAHVHMLERYLRFWEVCRALVTAGVLPLRAKGIAVLDVGIGPAPACYAIADFYRTLNEFAKARGLQDMIVSDLRVECVDSGEAMGEFLHALSEYSARPEGPFRVHERDFREFDPPARLKSALERRVRELQEDGVDNASAWIQENEPAWNESWHYDLCIFSNFFTSLGRTTELTGSISRVFQAMRPGGLVVVVGGTGAHYPALYERLNSEAGRNCADLVVTETQPTEHAMKEGRRAIKQHYDEVWRSLRDAVGAETAREIARKIPPEGRELHDSEAPYRAPSGFGLRVYRKRAPTPRRHLRASQQKPPPLPTNPGPLAE